MSSIKDQLLKLHADMCLDMQHRVRDKAAAESAGNQAGIQFWAGYLCAMEHQAKNISMLLSNLEAKSNE